VGGEEVLKVSHLQHELSFSCGEHVLIQGGGGLETGALSVYAATPEETPAQSVSGEEQSITSKHCGTHFSLSKEFR